MFKSFAENARGPFFLLLAVLRNGAPLHPVFRVFLCHADAALYRLPSRARAVKLVNAGLAARAMPGAKQPVFGGPLGRGQTRVVLHVDMDCFFVSVLLRNRPELRERPVAVAHNGGFFGKEAFAEGERRGEVFTVLPVGGGARTRAIHSGIYPVKLNSTTGRISGFVSSSVSGGAVFERFRGARGEAMGCGASCFFSFFH